MIMKKVVSSNIKSIGWSKNNLFVEYLSGNIYSYSNVSKELYKKLLKSESKGHFMNTEIKGKYDYIKTN